MTFRRSSSIHFVPAGRSKAAKGAPFTALSLVAGWWGIPWGPVWTLTTTVKNLGGGIDVTPAVMAQIAPAQPIRAVDAPLPVA
jgi:hypothetical protein